MSRSGPDWNLTWTGPGLGPGLGPEPELDNLMLAQVQGDILNVILNAEINGTWLAQGSSLKVFVKKKVQRCGVWQIKPMTSPDQDPLSTKSNMCGFRGYSQIKSYKGCKND